MSDEWHFRLFGQEFGPITLEEIARMLARGELSCEDAVRQGREGEWIAARSVEALGVPPECDSEERGQARSDVPHAPAAPTSAASQSPLFAEGVKERGQARSDVPHAPAVRTSAASQSPFFAEGVKERGQARSVCPPSSVVSDSAREPVPFLSHVHAACEFFLLVEGSEYGPLTRDELQKMAAAGRLRTYHQIRAGAAGQWVPLTAAAVALGIDPSLVYSAIAAPRSAAAAETTEALESGDAPRSRTTERADYNAGRTTERADYTARRSRRMRGLRSSAIIGGGVAIVVVAGFFLLRKSDADYYQQIWSLYVQYQALREQNAAEAEWNEWRSAVRQQQAALVPPLEAAAGAAYSRRARQHMLFAVRDHLAGLPQKASADGGPSQAEQEFTAHMDSALALIEGRGPSSPARFSAVEIALALTCLVQLAAVAWLAAGLVGTGRSLPTASPRVS